MRCKPHETLGTLLVACAFSVLLGLKSCGGDSEGASGTGLGDSAGASLFRKAKCGTCHGAEAGGLRSVGPALRNLSSDWTAAELSDYLRDPAPFRESKARVVQLSAAYFAHMRPFPELGKQDRGLLAEWLLERF